VSGFLPADHAARARARLEHDRSFVLEAGAGTGKTTLLVDRIEALVLSGRARLDEIAAVTFTENAATTTKLRLRERLEQARVAPGTDALERERAAAALEVLERSPIATIHALCAAMLAERPLECGVSPGFRVADETETDQLFQEAWEEWLSERLATGDSVILEALDQDIPLEPTTTRWERSSLRGLARTLLEQRDLAPLVAASVDAADWRRQLGEKADRARELLAFAKGADGLRGRLEVLVDFADRAGERDGGALAAWLLGLSTIPRHFGHRPNWSSAEAFDEAKRIGEWTHEASAAWTSAFGASLHGRLVEALLEVVERYERKKKGAGALDFVDLLLLARNALRDRESVRRYFRGRFRRVLVDEFQDTDPLQVDVVEALTGGVPGALVVVGDAKQSIYRFRRAEVALFRRASEDARRRPGHDVLHLVQNFRARPAILRFVNRVFSEIVQESEEAGQPPYEALEPPPGLSEDAAVVALRFETEGAAEGEDLLRAEARALATWIARAARGAESVRDPRDGVARPSRAGDVMVLVRRLTQIRHLEAALQEAGVRFTVEGGKSFFDRQEVHETLAALRAVEDPSDRVSLVAALRSSFFGVSDRDIVTYALHGGALAPGEPDASLAGAAALGPALGLLAELHRERLRLSVPALLDRLYDETRVLAALTGSRRGEAQVANLEKVVALARQAHELGVLTLRGFARLLEERVRNAREEPDLPSTRPGDPDTVRILSIHKAKGLEAPIVALHDTADRAANERDVIPLWEEGRVAIGFRKGCQPPGWDGLAARERARSNAELKRLLYVACTRARDLLVIPKPPGTASLGGFWKDLIDRLPPAGDADVRVVDAETLPVPEAAYVKPDLRGLALAAGRDVVAERWETERAALLARAGARALVPVPALRVAARSAPPPVAAAGTPDARAFGSLVHRILEAIPLYDPQQALPMAEALATGFGLTGDAASRAAGAVERALGLPVMERARASGRVFRELKLWFPLEGELVEGAVDLVFEEDGELVIVDYKTDAIAPSQALEQAAHHAPQLQLYGRGLAVATGLRIRERVVLFTTPGEAIRV
jgi:ATP-dependent helicase/nuclease subunit A